MRVSFWIWGYAGVITILAFLGFFLTAHAQVECPPNVPIATCIEQFNVHTGSEAGFDTSGEFGSASNVTNYIQPLIQGALGLVGTLFFIYMFYGGYLWFTSAGNDERLKHGQDAIRHAIIGLIIIVGAYAITGFILSRLL